MAIVKLHDAISFFYYSSCERETDGGLSRVQRKRDRRFGQSSIRGRVMVYLRVSLDSLMDAPDPPASVGIEMSDSDTLRGTLVEERTDG